MSSALENAVVQAGSGTSYAPWEKFMRTTFKPAESRQLLSLGMGDPHELYLSGVG